MKQTRVDANWGQYHGSDDDEVREMRKDELEEITQGSPRFDHGFDAQRVDHNDCANEAQWKRDVSGIARSKVSPSSKQQPVQVQLYHEVVRVEA